MVWNHVILFPSYIPDCGGGYHCSSDLDSSMHFANSTAVLWRVIIYPHNVQTQLAFNRAWTFKLTRQNNVFWSLKKKKMTTNTFLKFLLPLVTETFVWWKALVEFNSLFAILHKSAVLERQFWYSYIFFNFTVLKHIEFWNIYFGTLIFLDLC